MTRLDEPKKSLNAGEAALSKSTGEMSPSGYLREVRALLAKGRHREAYQLLEAVMLKHPGDPILLSYSGYLTASVGGKYRKGIESCERAILLFEKISLLHDDGINRKFSAVLYLNLAKAYLAGEKRKEAFAALQKGQRFDPNNREVLAELEGMGIRKYVPLPFLERSNPINTLFGRMLRKMRG
jgi:tetratricopeptide (TPR) repeat protein